MSNAPERYLCWRWEDESETNKLEYSPDSKKPNAGTFVLAKEDHTLGNLIRVQLLSDPKVRFAAYRMPHPLVFDAHIRVETMDGRTDPVKVFEGALNDLSLECESLDKNWKSAVLEYERNQGF